MKVLLVGEGKHEHGIHDSGGALSVLSRRLLNHEVEFVPKRMADREVHTHITPGKGGRFFKRAIAWIKRARQLNCDAIILVMDEDGDPTRVIQIDEAQSRATAVPVPRALGVAIRTFDAWMLADEHALSETLGTVCQRQPGLERLPDPKNTCAQLLQRADRPLTQTKMYASVAELANLDTLCERCPRGFAPFAQRVRALPGNMVRAARQQ